MKISQRDAAGFEELWEAKDPDSGFHAFIAIHSTRRGSAIGGVRFRHYTSESEAIEDVKQLAEAMTYKAALADLPHGGAKGVLLKPDGDFDRKFLYEQFAAFINELKGRYISAIDSGTTLDDLAAMKGITEWVGGAPQSAGGPGDASPLTALGVLSGIQVAAEEALGVSSLKGVRVVLQGVGSVGSELLKRLHEKDCELWISDINPRRLMTLAAQYNCHTLLPELIWSQECDVLAPCALGNVLNEQNIPDLKAKIVAGAANNQLSNAAEDSKRLEEKGILYAPDFVINAGGLIHIAVELSEYDPAQAKEKVPRDWKYLERNY